MFCSGSRTLSPFPSLIKSASLQMVPSNTPITLHPSSHTLFFSSHNPRLAPSLESSESCISFLSSSNTSYLTPSFPMPVTGSCPVPQQARPILTPLILPHPSLSEFISLFPRLKWWFAAYSANPRREGRPKVCWSPRWEFDAGSTASRGFLWSWGEVGKGRA